MNCAYVIDICVAFLEQVFDMQLSTFNIVYQNDQDSLLRVHTAYTRLSSAIRDFAGGISHPQQPG